MMNYRMTPGIRFRIIDGEALILHQSESEVIGLNRLGSQILELLKAGLGRGEILDRLETETDVARDRLAEDLDAFLDELVECNILEVVSEQEG